MVELFNNGKKLPNIKGIVQVCIEDDNGQPQNAVICYGGESTFNKGAAAASYKQAGYGTIVTYGNGHK